MDERNNLLGILARNRISRRQFLRRTALLGVTTGVAGFLIACGGSEASEPTASSSGEQQGSTGSSGSESGSGSGGTVRWVSPRGTIEVLDDYPYWVAKKFGWFGDIETTLEPGPIDATATTKLVDSGQADFGYPSPGVYSLALEAGIPIISVWQMGAYDVFDFAVPKGSGITSLEELKGKTIALGSAGWQSIADPEFGQLGIDPSDINYVDAGQSWGQTLAEGKADAALSWEGLRAQWKGQGLDFDYIFGRDFSKFPANSFVIRKSDLEDDELRDLYTRYLRGWAMGMEFGHLNPRAATQITMEEFPALKQQMDPPVAVESMMQLANVYRGDFSKRQGWGWHDPESWEIFLNTSKEIGQIQNDYDPNEIISNEFVPGANDFDKDEVQKQADEFELSEEYEAVDVEAIRQSL